MAKLRTSSTSHALMSEMGRHYDLPYAAQIFCQIYNSGNVLSEEQLKGKCSKHKFLRDELHITIDNSLKNSVPANCTV